MPLFVQDYSERISVRILFRRRKTQTKIEAIVLSLIMQFETSREIFEKDNEEGVSMATIIEPMLIGIKYLEQIR